MRDLVVASAATLSLDGTSLGMLTLMKTLFCTRTSGEFDWERRLIELHRPPSAGEYIAVPGKGSGEAERHEVRLVVHLAACGGDAEAEVYCNRIGPRQMKNLAWKGTAAQAESVDLANVGLLTAEQAAKAAQVSVYTIRRLCETGRLKACDYGTGGKRHDWRINPDELKSVSPLPEEQPAPAEPPPIQPRQRRRRRSVPSSILQYLPRDDAPITKAPA